MKTFKRLFALFLALFAVLGLASCDKASDGFSIYREQKIAELASLNEVVDEIEFTTCEYVHIEIDHASDVYYYEVFVYVRGMGDIRDFFMWHEGAETIQYINEYTFTESKGKVLRGEVEGEIDYIKNLQRRVTIGKTE